MYSGLQLTRFRIQQVALRILAGIFAGAICFWILSIPLLFGLMMTDILASAEGLEPGLWRFLYGAAAVSAVLGLAFASKSRLFKIVSYVCIAMWVAGLALWVSLSV